MFVTCVLVLMLADLMVKLHNTMTHTTPVYLYEPHVSISHLYLPFCNHTYPQRHRRLQFLYRPLDPGNRHRHSFTMEETFDFSNITPAVSAFANYVSSRATEGTKLGSRLHQVVNRLFSCETYLAVEHFVEILTLDHLQILAFLLDGVNASLTSI